MSTDRINQRAQDLLKRLVRRYIQDGQPVASKVLACDPELNLSPATIRNVMSDLEEKGFLASPHTSAGRVPTTQAYRLFVNSILTTHPVTALDIAPWQGAFSEQHSSQQLMARASEVLTGMTSLAGLVTLPKPDSMTFTHIEFVPLSENRILVILVLDNHEVQNRIIYTNRVYPRKTLIEIANFLTHTYAGKDLTTVRETILAQMKAERREMDDLLSTALEMADKVLETVRPEEYVFSGEDHLLDLAEATTLEHLRDLFQAFTKKQHIIELLNNCLSAQGVQIFIGEESGYAPLDACSLVTAPYSVNGSVLGMLGVIGPTRMAYEKVIPIVDVTAKLLSAALNQTNL